MKHHDIFESFNARYLSYEDIAKSFIPNHQYTQLCSNNHTLLLGPRGSGKTTLLKVLTPSCQNYLKKQDKKDTFVELDFYAIYVPTDIQWKKQIDLLANESNYQPYVKDLIPKFLVASNICICLVDTFKQILNNTFSENDSSLLIKESSLCKELIEVWDLERPIVPTFDSIRQSFYKRLKKANTLLNILKYQYDKHITFDDYYFTEFFDYILLGCNAFESVLPELKKNKWALCFDELEISPDWLQRELLQKFRSTDQRFIFKLTTSPFVNIKDQVGGSIYGIEAREGEDYRVIRTWNHNLKDQGRWNTFAETLATERLFRIYGRFLSLENLFGKDSEERALKDLFNNKNTTYESQSLYDKGNVYWTLFKQLAKEDSSFKSFLIHKGVNPNNPIPVSTPQLDSVHRKVLQIALFRFHFIKNNAIRSRKNTGLYYGIPRIYQLCDGNPRFLIGLLDELTGSTGEIPTNALSTKQQAGSIRLFSDKYLKLISSHPDSNKEISDNYFLNLGDLLSMIGNYFKGRLIRDSFKMDPYSTFIVDKDVPEKVVELIEMGVHLGALIYLNPNEVVSQTNVRDKKFRLSYLLNPIFSLPIREYNSVKLSTILSQKNPGHSLQLTFDI